MPFSSTDIDPADVKVNVNLRVTLAYRNQLVERAAQRGLSLNSMLVHAVEKEVPPK